MLRDNHIKSSNGTHTPPTPPENHAPPARRRILVVDDNEMTCKQLQKILQADSSLQVEYQTDGNQALEALAQDNYSIVLTDLRMPKLDGMDLIRQIQQRRLPVTVIVTTGHGIIDEAVQAIRLGAYDFLTKPVDVDHLRWSRSGPCASVPCKTR